MNAAKARLAQTEAQAAQVLKQRDGADASNRAAARVLTRARDQFSKTTIRSTLDGIITYLPVNEGEIAIVGVQNQPGTVLMTIADMSVITAEVKVDETDIVNVKLGQEAKIKVDALGDQIVDGARFRSRQQRADAEPQAPPRPPATAARKRKTSKSS